MALCLAMVSVPAQADSGNYAARYYEHMRSMSAGTLRLVKMRLEQELEARFSLPLFCHMSPYNCILAYDRLDRLRARWPLDDEAPRLELLQVDVEGRSFDEMTGSAHVSYLDSADDMARILDTASPSGLEGSGRWEARSRGEEAPLSHRIFGDLTSREIEALPHPTCDESADYYESFFAADVIRIGIYFGYLDLRYLAGQSGGSGKYQHHLHGLAQYMQRSLVARLASQGFTTHEEGFDGHHVRLHGEVVADGRRKLVLVEIVNPNVRCEDDVEVLPGIHYRGELGGNLCEAQRDMNDFVSARFEQSMRYHQMTMYLGHSRGVVTTRDGRLLSVRARGPSFKPFWADHRDLAIQRGALLELPGWEFSEKIFYMNSCSSFQHYVRDINALRERNRESSEPSGLTFVANRERNNLRFYPFATMALITGVLERKCGHVIRAAMDHNFMAYRESLASRTENFTIIDGEMGGYSSYRDGHPAVRVDDPGTYVNYEREFAPNGAFESLRAMSRRPSGRYVLPVAEGVELGL